MAANSIREQILLAVMAAVRPAAQALGASVHRSPSVAVTREQCPALAVFPETDAIAERAPSQLASLAACDWIRSNQNLLIQGATGCGKTYLACALAHQACRQGLSAWYVRAPRLFEELNLCHADGSFRKRQAARDLVRTGPAEGD